MKRKRMLYRFVTLLLCLFSVENATKSAVTTYAASAASSTSATLSGNVTGTEAALQTASIAITCGTSVSPSLQGSGLDIENTTGGDAPTPGDIIDLGLSVKWAGCNIGADSPEKTGGYYAWGETEEKSDYSKESYKFYDAANKTFAEIGKSISGTQYDVARAKLGKPWRMPTMDEQKELCQKCTWKWMSYNGVNGQLATGPNGNSIFFPVTGYRDGATTYEADSKGCFWSGSLHDGEFTYGMYITNSDWGQWNCGWLRHYGLPVRPVAE